MPQQNDPCTPLHGPTDSGRVAIGVAWQLAAAALAAVNTVTSAELASRQFDLAQRYFNIARAWRDWYNLGFVPLEDKELDEIWAERRHEPLYDAAAGRASVTAKLMFRGKIEEAARCTHQYATGLRQALVADGLKLLAEGVAATEGMGLRNERAHAEAMDSLRWNHRMVAVQRGRGLMAVAAGYGQLAAGIYGSLSNQAAQAAGSYARFIGYAQERIRTMYPGRDGGDGEGPGKDITNPRGGKDPGWRAVRDAAAAFWRGAGDGS